MDSIYKIAFVGIAAAAAISCLAARVLSEDMGTRDNPVVIETEDKISAGFTSVRDATIEDEGAAYSGESWLGADGSVRLPEWFEGDKLIIADGTYYLIKAKDAPLYYENGGEFPNMIDIGNAESESTALYEAVNDSEAYTREVDGHEYSYRTLGKNGAMALNLACSPDTDNYLTVRFWGGDTGDTMLWLCDPASGNMNDTNTRQPHRNASVADRRDWTELNACGSSPQYDGGFVYATYLIPRVYTEGKTSVSLRLYSTGGSADYGNVLIKEQKEESRGIYDAYMTQSAAFNPADFESVRGGYSGTAENLYSVSDFSDTEKQKSALKEAVLAGIETLRGWQLYGDEAPPYMQGMITRSYWRDNAPETEEEWRNRYYNDSYALKQNLTPLNLLEFAAVVYNNADKFGIDDGVKAELLDRAVSGIDFLCRAQGSNGGFYSDGWIGGPERKGSGGNNLTGFGLRRAAKCATELKDVLSPEIMNEEIDSDADGVKDKRRAEAWAQMLTAARDYLIDINGGYGHAPNQDMANSAAALRLDEAAGFCGGNQMTKSRAASVFDRCFGVSKNLATSSYWVSAKGTILENFGSLQGGYSGDYGSNAIVLLSELSQLASDNYGFNYGKYMPGVYDTIDKYYSTGKKLENGAFVPSEYAEGIISNRNIYYHGTERYPIDIYGALALNNDTALKIIANYIEQRDFSAMLERGGELTPSNAHFEDNILDAAYLYINFDEITEAARERNIEDYRFFSENPEIESFAWADETARNVVIKDNGTRVYMALNWRNPAYSTTIYTAGEQSVRANNLCRIHMTTDRYDTYGCAAMTTDGYKDWTRIAETDGCMEALMIVKYGCYKVIMNSYNCGGEGNAKSFAADSFEAEAGLDRKKSYLDMISGNVYSYGDGYWHNSGRLLESSANSTLVLKELGIFSGGAVINGDEISAEILNNTDKEETAALYGASYDGEGRLLGVSSEKITAAPGRTYAFLKLPYADKAFIWQGMEPMRSSQAVYGEE